MNQPSRALGFWSLVALVAGNMIGAGVFLLPASLAKFGNMGLVAWACTAVGATLLALVFAQLSLRITKSGGPYAYCQEAFGDFMGFEIAYNYWIAAWIGNAALCVSFVGYLSFFFPHLVQDAVQRFLIEIVLIWGFTFVCILGFKAAAFVQIITTILKILPLLLLTFVGIFFIHPEHFAVSNISPPSPFRALNAAATLTLWSFIGLESATVPSGEVVKPGLVWKATVVGTLFVGLLYLSSAVVVIGMIPYSVLQNSDSPYAAAASLVFAQMAQGLHLSTHLMGFLGGGFIAIGAMIAAAGSLNGWILLQALVPQAAANDGLFPKIFAKTNRRGMPIYGLLISSVAMTLLLSLTLHQALVKQFTFIILLATLAQLIPYFFTCGAEFIFLFQDRSKFSRANFLKYFCLTLIATLYAFWAIAGAGQEVISYGMLLFLSGVFLYVTLKR